MHLTCCSHFRSLVGKVVHSLQDFLELIYYFFYHRDEYANRWCLQGDPKELQGKISVTALVQITLKTL
jgi:hypothetical protein